MRYRITLHYPLQEVIRGTERTVSTDKESDMFEIKRRTKQGDPLSSLLFNTVLHVAMNDDVERWQKFKKAWVFEWANMNLIASQTFVLLTTCSPVLYLTGAAPKNDV